MPCFSCCVWMQLKGVPTNTLSCCLAEEPNNIAAYGSFLVARGVVSSTLGKHISALRKLVAWRCSQGQLAVHHAKLQAVLTWMDALHKQSHNACLPSKAGVMKTNLPHAKDFIAFQLGVEAQADKMLSEDTHTHGTMMRRKTAVACQDAALLALMAGYLPPPRLAALRSLCHPDSVWSEGGCMDDDCR